MFEITVIDTDYLGEKCYHAGLLYKPLEHLLVIPSIWIGSRDNPATGLTYAKALQQFCNHLASKMPSDFFGDPNPNETVEECQRRIHKLRPLLEFWQYVGEHHIKVWKTDRLMRRDATGSVHPINKTIDDQARIVAQFLSWTKDDRKIPGIFEGRRITTVAEIKGEHLLKGMIGPFEREVLVANLAVHHKPLSGSPPQILAKRHQSKAHEYLHDHQIKRFLHAFPDKVWKYICGTTYITGLRDHEVLAVPRYVRYKNGNYFTSIPSEIAGRIANGETTQILHVLGKGEKDRKVVFPLKAWFEIMTDYEDLYQTRLNLYRKNQNALDVSDLHLLWFNKIGQARYCLPGDQLNYEKYTSHLKSAVYRVATRGGLAEQFQHRLDFYCIRATFATNFLLNIKISRQSIPGQAAPTEASFLSDQSLIQALGEQMGHNDIRTTYKHYVHNVFNLDHDLSTLFPTMGDILHS